MPLLRAAKLGQDLALEYARLKGNLQLDRDCRLDRLMKLPDFYEFLKENNLKENDLKVGAYFEYLFLLNFRKYADLKKLTIERIPESKVKNKPNPDFLVRASDGLIVVEVSTYDLPEEASTLIEINKPIIDFVDQVTFMLAELHADNRILTHIIGYKEIMRKIKDKIKRQLSQYCEGLEAKHRKVLILDAFYLIADDRLINRDFFRIFRTIIFNVEHYGLDGFLLGSHSYDECRIMLNTIREISNLLKKHDTLLLFSLDRFNSFQYYGLVAFNGDQIFEYGHQEFFGLSHIPMSGEHQNVIELKSLFKKACDKGFLV